MAEGAALVFVPTVTVDENVPARGILILYRHHEVLEDLNLVSFESAHRRLTHLVLLVSGSRPGVGGRQIGIVRSPLSRAMLFEDKRAAGPTSLPHLCTQSV